MRHAAPILVGIGGWVFPPWRGTFYPPGLRQADELAHLGRTLGSVEINATFHGTQKPQSFRNWAGQVPDGFTFSVKGPRAATWRHDLAAAAPAITRFLDSGIAELGPRLGAILWQLPPTRAFDPEQIDAFLSLLPPAHCGVALRHAIETPHPSFADPRVPALLRRHGVAWACIDADGYADSDTGTAGFVYARLKRNTAEHPHGYAPAALAVWSERLRALADTGKTCFVYFIGGEKARAPLAAMELLRRLRADAADPGQPG
jgi:uncharacterized protein YecE (DUF72 family)